MSGTKHGAELPADPAKELWADLFLERLAPNILAGLTQQQRDEIRRAALEVAPGRHQLDWRVSLPLLSPLFGGKRVYGVLLAGSDRRGPARRQQDRMIRRRPRASGARLGAQVLAAGLSLAALVFMVVLGLTHAG